MFWYLGALAIIIPILLVSKPAHSAASRLGCDSFKALQACLAALPADGGRISIPPNVVIDLHTTLVAAKPNVTIQGSGWSTVIQRGNAFSGVLVQLLGDGDIIRDLTIDGNGRANVNNRFAELSVKGRHGGAERVRVINARAIGVSLTGNQSLLKRSTIIGMGSQSHQSYGVWALGHAYGIVIADNTITGSGIDAIGGDGPGLRIEHNQVSNNHCYRGIGGGQIAVYNDQGDTDGVTIRGNVIGPGCGPISSGMELNGRNITVENNIVHDQKYNGIVLESGEGYVLKGNTVKGSGTATRGYDVVQKPMATWRYHSEPARSGDKPQ